MILAIIQARMGSTRLPGKAMLTLMDRPVIAHIIERVRRSKVDSVVVAMTDRSYDDEFALYVERDLECPVFRGSENDVLERFYLCAKPYSPDAIVRVTADDPLKEPELIDLAIDTLLESQSAGGELDYVSNTLVPSYPEGLDTEVFRFSALEKAYQKANLPSEREHVTPYIWKNPELFRVKNFTFTEDLSHWRWTLDKPEDLGLIERIYKTFYQKNPAFSYKEVIAYLKDHPELLEINSSTVRNEGYLRSLAKESNP